MRIHADPDPQPWKNVELFDQCSLLTVCYVLVCTVCTVCSDSLIKLSNDVNRRAGHTRHQLRQSDAVKGQTIVARHISLNFESKLHFNFEGSTYFVIKRVCSIFVGTVPVNLRVEKDSSLGPKKR